MHCGMLCHAFFCLCASLAHNKLYVSTEAKWGQSTFAQLEAYMNYCLSPLGGTKSFTLSSACLH